MTVINLQTESDQDFVIALTLCQAVDLWDTGIYYVADALVLFEGKVWHALLASNAVPPGSDGTKWELSSAPPIDLTGSTLRMMARAQASDIAAPLSLTSAGGVGIVITDAVNGKFTMTLPFASLSAMPPGIYIYSVIRLRPDGLRELSLRGTVTHSTGPTR